MFEKLQKINEPPKLFGHYTADQLWNDPYISQKMLEVHLSENTELASRPESFIDRSVEWIISHFDIDGKSGICDFGCGPGLYTTRFAQSDADVTGIDFSERSVNYAKDTARNKNLSINYHYQDYLRFETSKQFDLITMIYCDFCVLSPEQRKTLLGKFYKFLKNNGRILLDVYSLNQFNMTDEKRTYEHSPENGFWSPETYYEFLSVFRYEKEKVILYKHTIIEKKRNREIFHH